MKKQGLKRQALTVAATNGVLRGMGFALRVILAALLGAEALGVSQMAAGVYFLALTPVVAGLPAAISRLTAREKPEHQGTALKAGQSLAFKIALVVAPLFLVLSPMIARLLGDTRTLYALMVFTPVIPILGLSCALDGYMFGLGEVAPPLKSDLLEQILRTALCVGLLTLMRDAPTTYRAAVPALSMTVAEGVALVYLFKMARPRVQAASPWRVTLTKRTLLRLSVPPTLSRFLSAGLKTASNLILPSRLMASGLSYAQGVAALGVLSGMAMPILSLPAMLVGALGTVGTPAIAKLDKARVPAFSRRMLTPACVLGALGAAGVFLLAPFIARVVFRREELVMLLRVLCPMCLTCSVQGVLSGLYNGLALQKKLFVYSVTGSAVSLLATYYLSALPSLRLLGAGLGMLLGQGLTAGLALVFLPFHVKRM